MNDRKRTKQNSPKEEFADDPEKHGLADEEGHSKKVKISRDDTKSSQSLQDSRRDSIIIPKFESQPARPYSQDFSIKDAYVDERRLPQRRGRRTVVIPAKSDERKKIVTPENPFTEDFIRPTWLNSVYGEPDRSSLIFLRKIREYIRPALRANDDTREGFYHQIREHLHQYEHYDVDERMLRRSKLLDFEGLPQLFMPRKSGFKFPYDIVADSRALFDKWARRDFDGKIMRGLLFARKARLCTKLDTSYDHRIDWRYFGAGDLRSGAWWPTVFACMRDGAHGCIEAGISRLGDEGATSVLLANGNYNDEDYGDVVWYCGTEGSDGMTADTRALFNSMKNSKPVRVIRSARLNERNPFRPECGIRYDGIYEVCDAQSINKSKEHFRFKLQRLPNQDPIRCSGPGARPTQQDKDAYRTDRILCGLSV